MKAGTKTAASLAQRLDAVSAFNWGQNRSTTENYAHLPPGLSSKIDREPPPPDLGNRSALIEAGLHKRDHPRSQASFPARSRSVGCRFISPPRSVPKVSPALDLSRVPCYMTEPLNVHHAQGGIMPRRAFSFVPWSRRACVHPGGQSPAPAQGRPCPPSARVQDDLARAIVLQNRDRRRKGDPQGSLGARQHLSTRTRGGRQGRSLQGHGRRRHPDYARPPGSFGDIIEIAKSPSAKKELKIVSPAEIMLYLWEQGVLNETPAARAWGNSGSGRGKGHDGKKPTTPPLSAPK